MSSSERKLSQDMDIINCINWLRHRAKNYTPEEGKGPASELVLKHRAIIDLMEEVERYGKIHILPWQADYHTCHFCGEYVNQLGYESNGSRHFLSDCRPDLVEHEIGDVCTWNIYMPGIAEKFGIQPKKIEDTCYAYQDPDYNWTTEHKHFYPDGPM